jgi:hypothetical protein
MALQTHLQTGAQALALAGAAELHHLPHYGLKQNMRYDTNSVGAGLKQLRQD